MEEEIIIIEEEEEQEIVVIEDDIEYIAPTTQEKTIIPSQEQQIVVPDEGVFALSKVTVESVTSDIDSNIQPHNIKLGVNILGVDGNLEPDKPDQTKTITPTEETQTIKADTGYELAEVTIEPIPSEYTKVEGTIDITANGSYDVANYESANVNIGGISKGLVINSCDSDGFASEVTIIGMTEIPNYYLNGTSSTTKTVTQKLETINIEGNVTKVGNSFCSYQSLLTKIKLPNTIIEMGNDCFRENKGLTSFVFPANIQKIGTYFLTNTKITELEIPIGITEIPANSLRNNTSLPKIVCKGNITSIGTNAFYFSSNLRVFVLENVTSVPTLESATVFSGTPIANGSGYIYVPDNLVDNFKTATNWSSHANQIKGVSEL